jgi:glycosyltransferase involved in cell wall biosynthesis
VDLLPNGVDAAHYAPQSVAEQPESCTFWGRLDFEPNQQALAWFVEQVWPRVRDRMPTARFTVYGFQPTSTIEQMMTGPGLSLAANRPDIRADIATHAVVVLPFVSGGGIKNKLLEAAAMARPVIASPRALNGLRQADDNVFRRARTPDEWVTALVDLWSSAERRRVLGAAARSWVTTHHDWSAAARTAVAGVEASLAQA